MFSQTLTETYCCYPNQNLIYANASMVYNVPEFATYCIYSNRITKFLYKQK